MGEIIKAVGPFTPDVVKRTFDALVLSIIHQQISMSAAHTITARVRALCPRRRLSAKVLLDCSDETLRSAGLSRQKQRYVRSICEHFSKGAIKQAALEKMTDPDIVAKLTEIIGVGVWTAEMILMFNLRRCDVWPVDDLGLRHALQRNYRMPKTAKRARLQGFGDRFKPYRSIATWYLWRSLNKDIQPGFA
jgi:DNA-3-methyladenine glycosylase II